MPLTECKVVASWDHRSGGSDHRAVAEAVTITTPEIKNVKQDKILASAQNGGSTSSSQPTSKKDKQYFHYYTKIEICPNVHKTI